MDTPPVPPHGELIEDVREGAGISMQRAADAAGISKQTWNDVVKGRTASPRARTIARMAKAVGIPPERLESEGKHPGAAEILREILRGEDTPRPVPVAAVPSLPDDGDVRGEVIALLLEPHPEDVRELLEAIWNMTGESEKRRLDLMLTALHRGGPPPAAGRRVSPVS